MEVDGLEGFLFLRDDVGALFLAGLAPVAHGLLLISPRTSPCIFVACWRHGKEIRNWMCMSSQYLYRSVRQKIGSVPSLYFAE